METWIRCLDVKILLQCLMCDDSLWMMPLHWGESTNLPGLHKWLIAVHELYHWMLKISQLVHGPWWCSHQNGDSQGYGEVHDARTIQPVNYWPITICFLIAFQDQLIQHGTMLITKSIHTAILMIKDCNGDMQYFMARRLWSNQGKRVDETQRFSIFFGSDSPSLMARYGCKWIDGIYMLQEQ